MKEPHTSATAEAPEFITVYFRDSALILFSHVAEHLGLKQGYTIQTETEFWPILRANAREGIRLCKEGLKPVN